jgi:hypothetical protein
MQQSGQIIAQKQHPTHSSSPLNFTGLTPFLFNFSSGLISFLGQASTQKKHPLHFSMSIIILAIFNIFRNLSGEHRGSPLHRE